MQTLIFNTENQGVQKVHNSNGDYEDAFTYEYADAKGSFTITQTDETFQFTVDGNKLNVQVDPENPDFRPHEVRKLLAGLVGREFPQHQPCGSLREAK